MEIHHSHYNPSGKVMIQLIKYKLAMYILHVNTTYLDGSTPDPFLECQHKSSVCITYMNHNAYTSIAHHQNKYRGFRQFSCITYGKYGYSIVSHYKLDSIKLSCLKTE